MTASFTASDLNELLSKFKIGATCVDAFQHRHFSYYDLILNPGVRISKINRYAKELALAMRAKSSFIVTDIPEKGVVRLRTTNANPAKINFFKYMAANFDAQPSGALLPFLLGETDEGQPLWIDMADNPHLLVAGATNSGKSVFLHTLIANAICRADTELTLIDTKLVEFNSYYDDVMNPYIKYLARSYQEAIHALERIYLLMEARYECMSQIGIQSVQEKPGLFEKQLIIIDEVSDLMLFDKKDKTFETLLIKLAQKARAAGIFLVLATQRPSADVLTGLIKSNFPARLACRVSNKTDSRVILDEHGAENLAGRGDAILKLPSGDAYRAQMAYVEPKMILRGLKKIGDSIEQNPSAA